MPKPNELKVEVASVPHREDLVVQIWHGDVQVAEIRRVGLGERILLFAQSTGAAWDFELDDFLNAVEEAKARLAG